MSLTIWIQELEDEAGSDGGLISFDGDLSKGLSSSSSSSASSISRSGMQSSGAGTLRSSPSNPTTFLYRPSSIDEFHDPRTLIYLADAFPSELSPAYHSMEATSLLQAALEAQAEAELKAAQAAALAQAAAAAAAAEQQESQRQQLRAAVVAAARQRMDEERRQLEQAIEEEGLLDLMGARLLALRGYETASAGTRGGYAQGLPHHQLFARGGVYGYGISALEEDEPELDWLGAELASARSGAPLWIIDAGAQVIVDDEGHDDDAMQIDSATGGATPPTERRSQRVVTIQPTVELADASRPTTPRSLPIRTRPQATSTGPPSSAGTTRLASEVLDTDLNTTPVVSASNVGGGASASDFGESTSTSTAGGRSRQPTVMTEEEEAELEKSRPASPSRMAGMSAAVPATSDAEQRPSKTVKVADLRSQR